MDNNRVIPHIITSVEAVPIDPEEWPRVFQYLCQFRVPSNIVSNDVRAEPDPISTVSMGMRTDMRLNPWKS
ncbi:hypothetical protein VP1G_10629 [Cytospora mali]|uniref:Uncharacterized protein n=1 Tax=Cytospora mali TaxID=578113 RepID=A0A194USY1_CYTMA|nr:hypothetical protein VP1G_10629 [Valsa mali var. pyri (nom. inval.)]